MSFELKLFLLSCGILFVVTVVYLLLKKKISEWNVIAWSAGAVAILLISANPHWVDWTANQLSISYPPSLLFLFSTLILLVLVLYQSIQISALQSKLRQIAQHVAVQKHLDHEPQQAQQVQVAAASEGESHS